MFKMTAKQQKDLETIRYFIPSQLCNVPITEEDERMFLEHSERGLYSDVSTPGLEALRQGKIWRGRHAEIYEEGVLEGSMPYTVIFEDAPRSVIEFMAREMFKGIDKELIESLYV